MALPKSQRLPLRIERERLTKTGKTLSGKFFTIVVAESSLKSSSTARFAILLSKKTASLAVNRNKIKRITSSLLETLLPTLPPKDYLVIPRKEVLTQDHKSLHKDIEDLLKK